MIALPEGRGGVEEGRGVDKWRWKETGLGLVNIK